MGQHGRPDRSMLAGLVLVTQTEASSFLNIHSGLASFFPGEGIVEIVCWHGALSTQAHSGISCPSAYVEDKNAAACLPQRFSLWRRWTKLATGIAVLCAVRPGACLAGGALLPEDKASLGQLRLLSSAGKRQEERRPEVQVGSKTVRRNVNQACARYENSLTYTGLFYSKLFFQEGFVSRYLAEACPDYKLHGFCALGNDCPFAHGVFEINLHPSKYRTQVSLTLLCRALLSAMPCLASTETCGVQMCTEGPRCKRKVCFFAHSDAQLRQPDYRYGYRTAAEAVWRRCCDVPRLSCAMIFL